MYCQYCEESLPEMSCPVGVMLCGPCEDIVKSAPRKTPPISKEEAFERHWDKMISPLSGSLESVIDRVVIERIKEPIREWYGIGWDERGGEL